MPPKTSKLSMAAMKGAASSLGIKLPKGDPKAAAVSIQDFYKDEHGEDNLAACQVCGWASPLDVDECPYCGSDLGEVEDSAPPPKDDEKGKTKTPKTKTPKKKGKAKPAKKKGAGKKDALAKPDPKLIAECDERIDRIKNYRKNLAEEAYNIGQELAEINDKNLWKAKGHGSFAAFCRAELDYTRVMAYKYMAMAKSMKKDDAVALGVSKANLIINAPPKQQKKLKKMALAGSSRSDLEKVIKEAEGKSSGSNGAPPQDNKITLIGRINEGDIFQPWIGDKSKKETKRDTKGKHIEWEFITGFVMVITEDVDSGTGLTFSFRKAE